MSLRYSIFQILNHSINLKSSDDNKSINIHIFENNFWVVNDLAMKLGQLTDRIFLTCYLAAPQATLGHF